MKDRNRTAKYTGIAIIGNGFDIAHGYATKYSDFAESIGEAYFGEYREFLRGYCGTDSKWSDFEDCVAILSLRFFHASIEDYENYEQIQKDQLKFNEWFLDLHRTLSDYLRQELARKPFHKIRSISRVLKKKTLALNFNYTDTASCYQSKVIHLHGSLSEDDIILGFDPPSPSCLAPYESDKWQKELRRDNLKFHRYIRSKISEKTMNGDYNELISGYDRIVAISSSNKGFEEEDINGWDYEDIYRDFLSQQEGHHERDWEGICFDSVKRLYVIGHGIIADKEYLTSLLQKCTQLKKVIIFSYNGEPEEEWKQKADFFKPFCKRVVKRRYTRLSRGR